MIKSPCAYVKSGLGSFFGLVRQIGDVMFSFCIFGVDHWVLLFITGIGLKWLINAQGWFPINIILTFLGMSKFRLTLGFLTPYLLQKYFKKYRNIPKQF